MSTPNIKATRSIVGIVARVKMSCGCYAMCSAGKARIYMPKGDGNPEFTVSRIPAHVCNDWKRHKYELSRLEEDLSQRVRKFYGELCKRKKVL